MNAIEIFIAYAHNDLRYKDELKKFLRPLLNTGQARVWDDRDIESGQDWEAEIKTRLYGADVILLLVSPDSLASDYFYGREVAVSLERHEKGEAVVAPVIIRPCHWTITPLRHIEAMPEKAKAVTSWASQDEAFTDIAQRVTELVEKLLAERQTRDRLQNARRDFAAAVQAADQLFAQNRWAEARAAYAATLPLHQNGFSPDRAALEKRRDDCAARLQQTAKKEDFEKRKAAFERALTRAGTLFGQQNWRDALNAYREAQRLREPDFPATEANRRIAERIAACEQALRPVAPQTPAARLPEAQKRVVTMMGIAISVLLVTVAALIFWPKDKKTPEEAANPAPTGSKTLDPASVPYAAVQQTNMAFVKGGAFDMGDTFGEGGTNEKPLHRVTVADFYMGKNEVTFDEYDAFCAATNRVKPADQGWGRGARPVINVSWHDAVAYCNWRSQNENLTPCYTINGNNVRCDWVANGYRLPTEAEWEYAARQGGQKVRFGNGKNIADPAEINFDARAAYKEPYSLAGECRQKTTPAGSFPPNSLGLCDLSGNVWEWCWDWYGDYPSSAVTNPRGPDSGSGRCVLGGSWYTYPNYCRASARGSRNPVDSNFNLGFRVVRH